MIFRILFSVGIALGLVACGGSSSSGDKSAGVAGVQATETREAVLIPTIYRLFIINKDKQSCNWKPKKSFYNRDGRVLQTVCAEDYDRCRLEGSCDVIENSKLTPIGFLKQVGSNDYWRTYDRRRCPYGSGYGNTCLDPFRSVAADLNYWKLGDVIYISIVDGVELPDGSVHDGFFTVRDTGGAINGPHRFDFYVGKSSQKIIVNIFSKMKLNDRQTQVLFRRASADETARVLSQRRYPEIPQSR